MRNLRIQKHLLPLVCNILFFGTHLHAQLSGIGVGGGGSISSFEYGDQIDMVDGFDSKAKTGGTGGIRLDFDLGSELFKFSPEFFIVQNGSKEFYTDFSVLQADLVRRVSLDYAGLYLPLTFYVPLEDGTGITDERYHGFLFQARVFMDYAINAEISSDILGESSIGFRSNSDKIDFGYSFEAGFVLQGMKFMFGYNWGIKNIEFSDALGDVNAENYLINNKGFTIQLGFLHKLE